MATVGLYGSSSSGVVAAASGSESTGLYGNNVNFGGSYFEWFIFQQADTQPATPTGGSWSFTTNSGTPPEGWSNNPIANPTNKVWVSIALVNSKNTSTLTWSEPGLFSYSSGLPILSDNGTPAVDVGQSDQLYIQLDTTPQTIWFKESGTWTRLTGSSLYVTLTGNQTIAGTKTFSSTIQGSISGNASNVTGIVGITNGGTGATTASGARTALGAAASGANADITSMSGVTGGITTPDYITFDTTPETVPTADGSLYWDSADGNQTLSLVMAGGSVVQQIGQEQYYRIKASAAITNGQVVMFTGSVGNSGALTGAPATGLTASTAYAIMGIATENIANNGWGYVTSFGVVRGIDTSAYSDGQILYYDPTVAGGLTATVPTAPNAKIQVCAVVNAHTNGQLFVRPTFGGALGQYEGDVNISSPADNSALIYDASTGVWANESPSTARTSLGLGTAAVLNAGVALGAATLDAGGTVPLSQIPASLQGGVSYQGTWNASTNTPTLTSSVGTKGYYYVVSVAGSTNLNGITDWLPGDWAIFNGTSWEKIDNTDAVSSVNGYTGAVSLTYSDVGAPSTSGTNATGTWAIDVTGNAATATTSTNVSGGTASVTSLTNSGSTTLSGGTANGVAYLNGSKVLTTGSALTFDGTNLGVGTSAAASKLMIGGSGANRISFGAPAGTQFVGYDGTTDILQIASYNDIRFQVNAYTEIMRLTSTGLGIGTSSPGSQISIYKSSGYSQFETTSGSVNAFFNTYAGGSSSTIGTYSNHPFKFATNNTVRATLDSSGNLGLGVTPSGWSSGRPALEFGGSVQAAIAFNGNNGNGGAITANAYFNGSNWIYKNSVYAAMYQNAGGTHAWYTASSGTAGNAISFTQAMTLDSSGRLGIGTTSPAVKLDVLGGSTAGSVTAAHFYQSDLTANSSVAVVLDSSNGNTSRAAVIRAITNGSAAGNGHSLAFETSANGSSPAERARIDSSGNLLVGQTSVYAACDGKISVTKNSGSTASPTIAVVNANASAVFVAFSDSASVFGSITRSGSSTAYNTSSDYRLKENIQDVTGSGAFIDALQPRTWNWKIDGSAGAGFIAHELQVVSPSSVTGTKDAVDADGNPEYQAVEYGSAEVIAMLVAEVKSLRKRLADAGIA